MDETLESILIQGYFSMTCGAILTDCEQLLDSSGELSGVLFNCQNSGNLQSNGEEVSFDINDILLDFTTSTQNSRTIGGRTEPKSVINFFTFR